MDGVIDAERGGLSGGASWPVLWIMEPSFRERIRVDWTPGREVRWESSAVTCCGTCCVRWTSSWLDFMNQSVWVLLTGLAMVLVLRGCVKGDR